VAGAAPAPAAPASDCLGGWRADGSNGGGELWQLGRFFGDYFWEMFGKVLVLTI